MSCMAKEEMVRVRMSEDSKASLETICKQLGMSQTELLSRTVVWLHQQSIVDKLKVLGVLSDDDLQNSRGSPHSTDRRRATG